MKGMKWKENQLENLSIKNEISKGKRKNLKQSRYRHKKKVSLNLSKDELIYKT